MLEIHGMYAFSGTLQVLILPVCVKNLSLQKYSDCFSINGHLQSCATAKNWHFFQSDGPLLIVLIVLQEKRSSKISNEERKWRGKAMTSR